MDKVWVVGDHHFGHKNIIKYCNRPFASVEEMEEKLIENWNQVVKEDDKVFVLGDFALCGKDKIIELGQKLKGRKTLILGNHDGASIKTYYEAGFEFVSKYPILYREFFVLSHEPQYVQMDGVYSNIFAHVHTNPAYTDTSARTFCVSVERIGYKPIDFEEIVSRMEQFRDKEN